MHHLLITPEETIEIAFSSRDQIIPDHITDARINAAQLKFLAPPLGALYSSLHKKIYTGFVREYIKPTLAHFLRYSLFLHLAVRIGNDGVIRICPTDSKPAEIPLIRHLRAEAKETARNLLDQALEYIRENPEDFPEFAPGPAGKKQVRMTGGIVL